MPRTARLDAPGVLHHVMIRGIERRKIFRNNKDREDFIERLEILCPAEETRDVGSKTTYEFTDLFKIVHYNMFLFG